MHTEENMEGQTHWFLSVDEIMDIFKTKYEVLLSLKKRNLEEKNTVLHMILNYFKSGRETQNTKEMP